MTTASLTAKIIHVQYKKGKSGLIFATSPDLKGLLVSERTLEAFEKSIPAAITDLYAACGEKVVVSRVEEEGQDGPTPWVAFPTEIARRALESSPASH
jgi:hypothetical protein